MTTRYPFAVIKEKLHARRGEVADFAMGTRRLVLPPELQEWLDANPRLAMRPASPDAVSNFRDAALELVEQEYGVSLDGEQIVPIPGGRVAMTAVAACVLKPGDGVLVTEPGYPAFARLAAHWHAAVRSVLLDPDKGFAPDFSGISTSDLKKLRIFSLNYPNNPSGGILTDKTRQDVMAKAAAAGALIFNDNVYGPLTYNSEPTTMLGRSSDIEVVELQALTKLYPIGPQGASFLAGSVKTMKAIATYAEFAWAPMSALQIEATTWCFRDREGRREIRAFFKSQLAALSETLIAIGLDPYPIPGGIYSLCKAPEWIAGRRVSSAEEAAVILMDEFDIAVVPWDPEPNHYLRFTSMYQPDDLDRLRDLGGRLRVNQTA